MTEKDLRWNKFIEEVCYRDLATLSDVQRKAVLCFWYDAEMNSGGYSGYKDCCPDTVPADLTEAIVSVGYKEIADNYENAMTDGEGDDWVLTDTAYYNFSPSLSDCLEAYVEKHKDIMFD